MTPSQKIYSSNDVTRITGVSLRRLQWWDENRIVCPVRSGHTRCYTSRDIMRVVVVAELRRKKIALDMVRQVMKHVDRYTVGSAHVFLIVAKAWESRRLKPEIMIEPGPERIIDILKRTPYPVCLISVSDQWRRVEAKL